MKKFIKQPKHFLASMIACLALISAATWAVSNFYNNITCPQDATSGSECTENEDRFLSKELSQIAYELSSGNFSQQCSTVGNEVSCNLGGQMLACFNSTDGYLCQNGTESYHIDCNSQRGTCYSAINEVDCKLNQENKEICQAILPEDKLCQLGLASCQDTAVPQSTDILIKRAITSICSSGQQSTNSLCDLINGPDGDQIIDALTPENLDLASDTTKVSQTQLFNYISQHLYQLRQGAPANTQQSSYFFDDAQQGFLPGQQWAASTNLQNDAVNDELENVINLSQDGRLSMYVNASFLTARQDLSELEGKSKSQVAMLTTGLDYRLSQGVVGGALSYADGSTEYGKNDSDFDSANYNATVYGSFYKKQWWLDGAVNYGLSRFNQQRDIFCTAASCSQISNTYYADYNGSTLSGQIASGYDFIWGGFSLSPFAQWQLGKVKTDSYSEKAKFTGPTATIAIDKQERDFSTASLGSYLRYSFATKKAVLVPYLRVVLNHELKDDAQYISGRLVGAANSDFIVRANDRDNNYATIGTGLSLQMQNGNAGFIDLETVEAYDNLSQYQLTGGWRFVF